MQLSLDHSNNGNGSLTAREHFERWMNQRTLDLTLRASSLEADASDEFVWPTFEQAPYGPVSAWSPLPEAAGEIRLLDSSLVPGTIEPIFVVVIELDLEAQMATLVSASPYLDAATIFETNLQHSIPPVHALQVWNLRRLPLAVLTQSWCAGRLHPDDIAVALSVAEAHINGITPPADILAFCGTRMKHPNDPRRQYLEEQAAILDHLQAVGAELFLANNQCENASAYPSGIVSAVTTDSSPESESERNPLSKFLNPVIRLFRPAPKEDDSELALAADTPAPADLSGRIGGSDKFEYYICYGQNGRALVRLLCESNPGEDPVRIRLQDELFTMRFEERGRYFASSLQTNIAFSPGLRITLEPQ